MAHISNGSAITPFLKWAGGKRWLVDQHEHLLDVTFDRYFEPFLGSGAVFFHLRPRAAVLSDANQDLIDTYAAIRDDWKRVSTHLVRHHSSHSKAYYYQVRDSRPRNRFTRAARFIYLNRTCWNGLYRVNLNGRFNVPIGTKSSVLLNTDDFAAIASALATAELRVCDFEASISQAKRGDFVFVDPPYTVKHSNNGFIKYNEGLFSWDDQVRLRDCVSLAIRRGAKVLVTNASHGSLRRLYKDVGDRIVLDRSSVIGGAGASRGRIQEMVVRCL